MGKKIIQHRFFHYCLPIVWMLVIFFLSSKSTFPGDLSPSQYEYVSSLAHIFLYVILTYLIANALMAGKVKFRYALLNAIIIAMIYGALDEWHQSFVPGREMHLSDWLLDIVGILVASNLFWVQVTAKNMDKSLK